MRKLSSGHTHTLFQINRINTAVTNCNLLIRGVITKLLFLLSDLNFFLLEIPF